MENKLLSQFHISEYWDSEKLRIQGHTTNKWEAGNETEVSTSGVQTQPTQCKRQDYLVMTPELNQCSLNNKLAGAGEHLPSRSIIPALVTSSSQKRKLRLPLSESIKVPVSWRSQTASVSHRDPKQNCLGLSRLDIFQWQGRFLIPARRQGKVTGELTPT